MTDNQTEISPEAPKSAQLFGPWVNVDETNDIYNCKGIRVAFVPNSDNAPAVAAAPELLRIAENAINVMEVFRDFEMNKSPRDYEFIEQLEVNLAFAREVVAKATGETN